PSQDPQPFAFTLPFSIAKPDIFIRVQLWGKVTVDIKFDDTQATTMHKSFTHKTVVNYLLSW
ncbi:MAG: hypothetical protein QXQ63_04125, partial [Candidatus Bathyarchaeia archaeon]